MAAYYNEFDPKTAAWLRELIKKGLIADGIVDERSITEVHPDDLSGFTQVHMFAGIGGWSYALRLAGWPDDFPVWTGSCPCQPFSCTGKRAGVGDERHLWPVWNRLIQRRKPEHVFFEQVERAIALGWMDGVVSDLEKEGYSCWWAVLGAHSAKRHHVRPRIYGVAHSKRERLEGMPISSMGRPVFFTENCETLHFADGKKRSVEPGISPMANGIPQRVVRLRGYGNAIVPQVAAQFVSAYLDCLP